MLFQALMINLLMMIQRAGQVPVATECLPGSGALGDGDQASPSKSCRTCSVNMNVDGGKGCEETGDELLADFLAPLPEVGEDVPNLEGPGEEGGFSEEQKKLREKLNKKWGEQMEEATAPIKIQVILF